jgi:hypothetical protein
VRSDRVRIVRDNCVIENFSKLRSEFHYKQRRARRLQGKRSGRRGRSGSPERDDNRLLCKSLRAREKLTRRVELLFYLWKTDGRRNRACSA